MAAVFYRYENTIKNFEKKPRNINTGSQRKILEFPILPHLKKRFFGKLNIGSNR